MKTDISTKIAGVKLETCVFNASGPLDETLRDLRNLNNSASSAIMMKSCTIEPRQGNPAPRYANLEYGSINSMGLPNQGYKAYLEFSETLRKETKKPIIASICGMNVEENITMFKAFNDTPVDLIEFNPGSPNTIGKPIVGYDTKAMDKLLKAVSKVSKKPFGVKLPPYFDLGHYQQIADIIKKYPVKFVTCINSIGNGLAINPKTERTLIKPKGGLGGIGGHYAKFHALANVRKFYELFEDKIQVIGAGGVYTGTDAFEFILAGASAVQIGTAFIQQGPQVFEKVQNELRDLMQSKGYAKLSDFRGKLKTLD
ncbi:MAG: dihydroorotate oxidase [Candidatus Curtissbacteria bacterium]|nr:dihydroorotate oxidase [Candidatus Curtissbacteria bacterium]